MSESVTPEFVRVPSLDGLVTAFRRYAETAADGTLPDGTPPLPEALTAYQCSAGQRTADQRVADAYAHAAALLDVHIGRLREQGLDKLNAPDLRARLALVEAELGRTRERAEMAEHKVGDVMRAALGLGADTEPEVLSDLTVTGVYAERQRWRDDYDRAVELVAKMHAAAMGGVIRGPIHGVTEDVWGLRVVCEALAQAAEQYLDTEYSDEARALELRRKLGDAVTAACLVLRPADADEHNEPIDVVNAIADVLAMRGAMFRISRELDELPRLPMAERKTKREQLVDLARQYAGAEPHPDAQTTAEILRSLLHDAWAVIANAGLHRGNWDHEHPEWVTAAAAWRDRFHQVAGIVYTAETPGLTAEGHVGPDTAPPIVNVCQADADAARYWAGEIWRLQSGMTALGIVVDGPVDRAAVDTALTIISATVVTPQAAAAPAPVDPETLAVLPELAAYADVPDSVPNEAIMRDMARLATMYRGVGYDAEDRPTEVLAVRRAAYANGLVPFPDPSAPIRGYRGGVPPMPKLTAAAVVTNTTGGPLTLTTPQHRQVTLAPGDILTVTAGTAS